MDRRKLLASIGTAATVGFAGCTDDTSTDDSNGGNGENDDGQNEGDEQPSLEEFAFPEHATQDNLEESEFISTHFDHLEDEGSATVSQTLEDVFQENSFKTETKSRISSDGILSTEEGEETTTEEWTEIGSSRGLIRRDSGFQTTYQITGNSLDQGEALSKRNAELVAGMFDFGGAASAIEIDGTLTARYDADSIAETEPDGYKPFGADEFTNGTASLFITEDGTAKRFTFEIDYQRAGRSQSRNADVAYSGIGTTNVSEPDWTETARDEGREFEPTVTDDGYLTLTMVNGVPISAGTRLSLSLSRDEFALPADLTVDDRVVVAVTGSDVSIGINEKPALESNFDENYVSVSIHSRSTTLYSENIDFYSR